MTRLLLAAMILSSSAAASPQPPRQPRVEETSPRARVANDPTIHPSAGTPPTALPARALAERGREEPGERRDGWALAQWKVYTLRFPSNAKQPISIPAPSVLMIRASWPVPADLTISVTRGVTSLKSVRSVSAPLGGRLATAQVSVTSPGQVVLAASGTGAATVTLHVGILPAR